jgi:hypothetical protein
LFDQNEIKDVAEHKPNSTINVLINKHNRGIVINDGKDKDCKEEETKETGEEFEQFSS